MKNRNLIIAILIMLGGIHIEAMDQLQKQMMPVAGILNAQKHIITRLSEGLENDSDGKRQAESSEQGVDLAAFEPCDVDALDASIEKDDEETEAALQAQQRKINELEIRCRELKAGSDFLEEKLAKAQEEKDAFSTVMQGMKIDITNMRKKLEGQLIRVREEKAKTEQEIKRLQAELEAAKKQIAQSEGALNAWEQGRQQLQGQLTGAQEAIGHVRQTLATEQASWKKYLVGAATGMAAAGFAAATYFLSKGKPAPRIVERFIVLKPQSTGPALSAMVAGAAQLFAGCSDLKVPAVVKPQVAKSGLFGIVARATQWVAGLFGNVRYPAGCWL